jgi:hypothetical protein
LISPAQKGVTSAVHTPEKTAFFKKMHLRYNLCRGEKIAPDGFGCPGLLLFAGMKTRGVIDKYFQKEYKIIVICYT